MKFKFALMFSVITLLSGCKKNDIDCSSNNIQGDLKQRILNIIAEKTGMLLNDPNALSHLKLSLGDFKQDDDSSTKETSQCKVNLTLTNEEVSGVAFKGEAKYSLSKDASGNTVLDSDSLYNSLDPKSLKPEKIDETPEQEAWRKNKEKAVAEKEKAEADAKAHQAEQDAIFEKEISASKNATDNDFKSVNQEQLMLLFLANSGRNVSDEEKLKLLSSAWNSEKDPFKKNDIKSDELEKINQELDHWKGVNLIKVSNMNFRLDRKKDVVDKNIITDASLSIRKPGDYDFNHKYFPIDMSGCNDSLKYGPLQIYRSPQNVSIMMVKNITTCTIVPKDEEEARSLSALFTSISPSAFTTDYTAYLLINGYDSNNVSLNTTLIRTNINFYHNSNEALNDKAPVLSWTIR